MTLRDRSRSASASCQGDVVACERECRGVPSDAAGPAANRPGLRAAARRPRATRRGNALSGARDRLRGQSLQAGSELVPVRRPRSRRPRAVSPRRTRAPPSCRRARRGGTPGGRARPGLRAPRRRPCRRAGGAESLAIGVVESEVLVMELAHQRAADGPHAKAHGPRSPRTRPAAAPLPPLVAPILLVLSSPRSSRTRTAIASPTTAR